MTLVSIDAEFSQKKTISKKCDVKADLSGASLCNSPRLLVTWPDNILSIFKSPQFDSFHAFVTSKPLIKKKCIYIFVPYGCNHIHVGSISKVILILPFGRRTPPDINSSWLCPIFCQNINPFMS